ncbi:MAG TPA: response regulator transcription factor [Terriglobales bacterium]
MKILIVDDDPEISKLIQQGLTAEHYEVDIANDAEEAQAALKKTEYELILLDLNLPGKDGIGMLKEVRATDRKTPVLVVTGRSAVESRIECLDAGADDCLVKPFSFGELSARIRALRRRAPQDTETVLRYGNVELNRMERKVVREGKVIDLTSREFVLLEYFMRHAGQSLTRSTILKQVWQLDFDPGTNVVEVYIAMLRKKLDEGQSCKLIRTLRGLGYQFGEQNLQSVN